jgi:hypothetical protein
MGRTERKVLIKEIEKKRKSKLICYLTSDRPGLSTEMNKAILPIVDDHLRAKKSYKKIDVLIMTTGGDILAGFGLSRLLREYSSWVGALIPDKCQSAGTLFALGANEIIMAKRATLSPIDPSTNRPLNPQAIIDPKVGLQTLSLSVESVAGFKALAEEDWKLGGDGLISAFRLLGEKVHPLALGDVFRAREQIQLLADKLLRQHRKDDEKIKKVIELLTKKLGSHDYLIYRAEAKTMLGDQVQTNDVVEDLMWKLYLDFSSDMELGKAYNWKQTLYSKVPTAAALQEPLAVGQVIRQATVDLQTTIIESSDRMDAFEEKCEFVEHLTNMNFTVPVTTISLDIPSSGWKTYA